MSEHGKKTADKFFSEEVESDVEGAIAGRVKPEHMKRFLKAAADMCSACGIAGHANGIAAEEMIAILPLVCHMLMSRTHTACAIIGTPMSSDYDRTIDALLRNIEATRHFGHTHARQVAPAMTAALSGGKMQ